MTATVIRARPSAVGCNIRTWIGFKQFFDLLEAGVLAWIEAQGISPRDLYHTYGLAVEIADVSAQLPAVLELGDDVEISVTPRPRGGLNATISVVRGDTTVVALKASVTVALVPGEAAADATARANLPPALLPIIAGNASYAGPAAVSMPSRGDVLTSVGAAPGAYLWSWRAAYYLCHYSDRVQHSGFVRCLEEVVDRYLQGHGLGVGRLLRERYWIPVVSRARVRLGAAAHMDDIVHTVFEVTDVLRDTLFSGTMSCWVERDGELACVATGEILHGYAISAGELAGTMAVLDPAVITALKGVAT